MLSEAQIIEYLQKAFADQQNQIIGIGDDAACIPKDQTTSYVISKDLFIENIHFRRRYFDPQSIAHKSLHINLSDIAAMGATSHFVLLAIALPRDTDPNWLNSFLNHFTQVCQEVGVILIGGDTTESKTDIYISITVIGESPPAHLKFRHGAKVDDLICIAGTLGEATAGLYALEKQIPNLDPLKQRFLHPLAKIQEGQWLGKQTAVRAMMDISDGLYIDLSRLCQSSQKGAVVELEKLLPSHQLSAACQQMGLDPLQCLLVGGEDYALLMTIDPAKFSSLNQSFIQQFGYSLLPIGHIRAEKSVQLHLNGQPRPFIYQPFSHFGE